MQFAGSHAQISDRFSGLLACVHQLDVGPHLREDIQYAGSGGIHAHIGNGHIRAGEK